MVLLHGGTPNNGHANHGPYFRVFLNLSSLRIPVMDKQLGNAWKIREPWSRKEIYSVSPSAFVVHPNTFLLDKTLCLLIDLPEIIYHRTDQRRRRMTYKLSCWPVVDRVTIFVQSLRKSFREDQDIFCLIRPLCSMIAWGKLTVLDTVRPSIPPWYTDFLGKLDRHQTRANAWPSVSDVDTITPGM